MATIFIFDANSPIGDTSEFLVWIGKLQVIFNNLTHDHTRFEKYFLSTKKRVLVEIKQHFTLAKIALNLVFNPKNL